VIIGAVVLAEQRHHPVTQELIDATSMGMDGIEDHIERARHDRAYVFGIEALRHRRESADIDEENSCLLTFAPDGEDGAARAAELLLGGDWLPAELAARSD